MTKPEVPSSSDPEAPSSDEQYASDKYDSYEDTMGPVVAGRRIHKLTGVNVNDVDLPPVGEQLSFLPKVPKTPRNPTTAERRRADVSEQSYARKDFPWGGQNAPQFPRDADPDEVRQPYVPPEPISDSQRSLDAQRHVEAFGDASVPEMPRTREDLRKVLRDTWDLLSPPKE